jgi:hypothetical protein
LSFVLMRSASEKVVGPGGIWVPLSWEPQELLDRRFRGPDGRILAGSSPGASAGLRRSAWTTFHEVVVVVQ